MHVKKRGIHSCLVVAITTLTQPQHLQAVLQRTAPALAIPCRPVAASCWVLCTQQQMYAVTAASSRPAVAPGRLQARAPHVRAFAAPSAPQAAEDEVKDEPKPLRVSMVRCALGSGGRQQQAVPVQAEDDGYCPWSAWHAPHAPALSFRQRRGLHAAGRCLCMHPACALTCTQQTRAADSLPPHPLHPSAWQLLLPGMCALSACGARGPCALYLHTGNIRAGQPSLPPPHRAAWAARRTQWTARCCWGTSSAPALRSQTLTSRWGRALLQKEDRRLASLLAKHHGTAHMPATWT